MNYSDIVEYCAIEVDRQGDGPMSVAHMFRAWEYAVARQGRTILDEKFIRGLNGRVRGLSYDTYYRRIPVTFASGGTALDQEHIPRQMKLLLDKGRYLPYDDFVKRFLEIHPFSDGNGRTASLIYNWLSGTLETPNLLPEFDFT